MKAGLAGTLCLFAAMFVSAQSPPQPAAAPNLDAVLAKLQETSQTADADITRLHIDKWKTDSDQKAQLQQIANSLHKNLTLAMPDLLREVQAGKGNVSATFRLYHNLNVLYEYLSSLADAAVGLGKKEEFDPLNRDVAALNSVRQDLSSYIEQAAVALEAKARPTPTPAPAAITTPKKIVVDDQPSQKSSSKKKKATPTPKPSPTPQ